MVAYSRNSFERRKEVNKSIKSQFVLLAMIMLVFVFFEICTALLADTNARFLSEILAAIVHLSVFCLLLTLRYRIINRKNKSIIPCIRCGENLSEKTVQYCYQCGKAFCRECWDKEEVSYECADCQPEKVKTK